jgi:hypothetical protein
MDESVLPGAPPCTRSASNQFREDAREVALIGEPTDRRDFGERQGRGYQQPFRMLDTLLHEPTVRRSSCRLLEGASEMGDRQAALVSEVRQSDFATQTLIQNLGSAAHLPRCQTAANRARVNANRVNLRVRGDDTVHASMAAAVCTAVQASQGAANATPSATSSAILAPSGPVTAPPSVRQHSTLSELIGQMAGADADLIGVGPRRFTLNHKLIEGRALSLSQRRRRFALRIKLPPAGTPNGWEKTMLDDADIFRELAPMLRVRPELQAICRFGAQWASGHEPERRRWAPFHIVTFGGCLIDAGDHIGIRLHAGDVAVLPHGSPHTVRALPTAGGPASVLRVSRSGRSAASLCGQNRGPRG